MFCQKCGKQLDDEAVICTGCGCPVNNNTGTNNSLVNQLSERYKINGIIWIIIAGIQIILGITVNWIFLIIGVLNLISGIQDINFSKSMLAHPVGIIDKVRPLAGPIIVLIYNLIFGGVLGVAGSIYYLVAIRNFAMNNAEQFNQIAIEHTENV